METRIKTTHKAFVATKEKKEFFAKEFKRINLQKNADIATVSRLETDLKEIDALLDRLEEVVASESTPAEVVLGARIILENLDTSDSREYVIMPRFLANPLIGVISQDAPLSQKMIGLKLGNTFKFRGHSGANDTYKVKQIDY